MHDDYFFMFFCWLMAGLITLILFMTSDGKTQELGWLAQKQIMARQQCAEILKERYE